MRSRNVIAAGLLVAVVAVSNNAEAHADSNTYLTHVQSDMPYLLDLYGSTSMLHEGYQICRYEQQGVTGASDLDDLIIADMPMSRTAGIKLQVDAEFFLGC
jgi:hypothetical protein